LVRVGASARDSRFASGVAPTPGVSGVAREERHVRHRAALRAAIVPEGALRVDVTLEVAVVAGIGVDEAAHRAVLRRHLGLDAAPGAAVAREDDLALHVHPAARQLLVVARHAVVHVDEGGGDVAVDRIGVVDGELLAGLPGGRVLLQHRLGDGGGETGGLDHLEQPRLRRREENAELLDARVVAPGAEEGGDELRVLLAVRRAEVVRPGGEAAHPVAQVARVQGGVEALLEGALGARALVREAEKTLIGANGTGHDDESEDGDRGPTACDHAPSVKRGDASGRRLYA
jgi:hypothetical protein